MSSPPGKRCHLWSCGERLPVNHKRWGTGSTTRDRCVAMQQEVGTIPPVDMRHYGIKSMRSYLLKTEILLDTLMKQFHRPAHPVSGHNLACSGPQIIAGKVLAATIRSVTPFRTHQLDLAYVAQVARGVSDANVHALACVPIRCQTNGVPLAPAMMTEKRVNVAPLLRCGGSQRERFRFDAASCT